MKKRKMDAQPGTPELCAPILPAGVSLPVSKQIGQTTFTASRAEIALAFFIDLIDGNLLISPRKCL